MKEPLLRKILKKIVPRTVARSLLNYKVLSFDLGQWHSIKANAPVDADKNPIPWYTYPAVEFLTQFDMSDKTVFEYGSGNSSIFWAKRAKEIFSVEDDHGWFNVVTKDKPKNQHVVLRTEKEEYLSYIGELNRKFDVIIIDGSHRLECSKKAKEFLKDGGMIILDNSDRFPRTSESLRSQDLIELDFSGFGPVGRYTWTTSLYLMRDFRFKASGSIQPIPPIGGRNECVEPE